MSVVKQYNTFWRKRLWFVLASALLLVVVAGYAIFSGSASINLNTLWTLIQGNASEFEQQIVLYIRLPRILAAIFAGTALAVSGAVMQSILRNPLASPFTLGISSAAAFGAAFAIVVISSGSAHAINYSFYSGSLSVVISAFLWSMLSLVVILMVSKKKGANPEIIILSGIVVSSLFGAGLSALQFVATEVQLASIIFWSFGDLGRASWTDVRTILCVLVPLLGFFFTQSWNYKSLQSGDEYAKSLGINVSGVRLAGLIAASLCTAVVVSFYGIIAFVGLVVPHIVRKCIGSDEAFIIPASAVFGGVFLLFSDTLARTLISPVILPVGILTSFIGAPLFLFLLLKGVGKGFWN